MKSPKKSLVDSSTYFQCCELFYDLFQAESIQLRKPNGQDQKRENSHSNDVDREEAQDAAKMKARVELVVILRVQATSRLNCRQPANSLLLCQTWTGFYQHQHLYLQLSKWCSGFSDMKLSMSINSPFGEKSCSECIIE